ncbi:WAT1-related protein [Artemisia annua]|uniref:WAT1-related protein n=1 Tax=Artemisia annua TaxID=35608 RepID=A0A2U1PVI0_ARTAN|nr:WAT1-related protein [Artemisia annua]
MTTTRSQKWSWTDDVLPFVAMLLLICLDMAVLTIVKAAMNGGMESIVYVIYHNSLGTLILLPFFVVHMFRNVGRLPLTFHILFRFFILAFSGSIDKQYRDEQHVSRFTAKNTRVFASGMEAAHLNCCATTIQCHASTGAHQLTTDAFNPSSHAATTSYELSPDVSAFDSTTMPTTAPAFDSTTTSTPVVPQRRIRVRAGTLAVSRSLSIFYSDSSYLPFRVSD